MLLNLIFCIVGIIFFSFGAILFVNAFAVCDNSAKKQFVIAIVMLLAAFLLLTIFDPGVPMVEMFRMIASGQ